MTVSSKLKILLVEDNPDAQDLYKTVLTDAGFSVDIAPDGETGLSLAQKGGYKAILLDILLPKMDGLALLAELNSAPPVVKNGPVLVLTNVANDKSVKEAYKLGAKQYLVKSDIDLGQLVAKVKAAVGN